MRSDFLAFTVLDKENDQFFRLVSSARRYNIPLLAFFTPKAPDYGVYISRKHLEIFEVLRRSRVQQFIFLDAWDTEFVAPLPLEVLHAEKLSFGGEKNCYPEPRYSALYPPPWDKPLQPKQSNFPFLNSGVIWGPAAEYSKWCPQINGHDQLLWTRTYISSPENFLVDREARVVLNLHSTVESDLTRLKGGGVRYNPTGTTPCILHGNGKWPLPNWL